MATPCSCEELFLGKENKGHRAKNSVVDVASLVVFGVLVSTPGLDIFSAASRVIQKLVLSVVVVCGFAVPGLALSFSEIKVGSYVSNKF